MSVLVLMLTVVVGITPLSEGQRRQLATTTDGAVVDGAGLYALLANVAAWPAPEVLPGADPAGVEGDVEGGLPPGVARPDWAALLGEPGAFRGDLFLVEGRYGGRQRRMELLRPGAWGEAMIEWGVVADAAGAGGRGEAGRDAVVAVVLFVDSGGTMRPPAGGEGARVRAVGRFYKVWEDRDATGAERRYPVFVARRAEVTRAGAGGAGGAAARGAGAGSGGASGGAAALFAAVLGGAVLLFVVKRVTRRRVAAAPSRHTVNDRARRERDANDGPDDDEDSTPPLPSDPAEALERLRGTH